MKLKKSVIPILIFSTLVLLAGSAYFTVVVPFLNFMFNKMPVEEKPLSPIVIGEKEAVIDQEQYTKTNNTPRPYEPVSTPEPEQKGTVAPLKEQTYIDFELPPTARNVLVLGMDEAAGLTDTIIIVSIDEPSSTIKMISIPRDAYVRYSDTVLNALESVGWIKNPGMHKINIAKVIGSQVLTYTEGKFDNRGINFLCAIIQNMLGPSFKIDDYVCVDFDGFMEMVEVFGGIWVTVDETIYNQYGQLLVPEGRNYLSPKEALFYVRTRKKFDQNGNQLPTDGDSYRKELQFNFIQEMMAQYITKDNINKAPEILNKLRESVFHSVNTTDKLSYYTKIALGYVNKSYYIEPIIITGEEIDPFGDHASYVEIRDMH